MSDPIVGDVSVVMHMPMPAEIVQAALTAFVAAFPNGSIDVVLDAHDLRGDNTVMQRETRGKAIVFKLPPADH